MAMGRTPPRGFGTATRLAPARKGATAAQAGPLLRRETMPLTWSKKESVLPAQMLDTEARWAWCSGSWKAPERTAHHPRGDGGPWRQSIGLASGGRTLWRVEHPERRTGLRCLRAPALRQQGRTGLAIKAFTCKTNRKVAAFSRRAGAAMSDSDPPSAIPQGHALPSVPPLQAIHSVGRSGFLHEGGHRGQLAGA